MSIPASPAWKPATPGLVSIIVLLNSHEGFTSACTRSIKAHISEPHEVLLISPEKDTGVVGFSQGANMGLRAAIGEYILLTDGSTVFTPKSLSGMLECLHRTPNAGLVAPMMNQFKETPYIKGRQQVPETLDLALKQANEFARTFRKEYRHRRTVAHSVTGGCFLFRRKLAEKIGLFDERFDDPWYEFEDEDYCIRAGIAGYSNHIAGDVFVFRQTKDPFIQNNRKFRLKWMELDKESEEGRTYLIRNAFERVKRLAGSGQSDAAVETLLNAVGTRPDAPEAYLMLANLFLDAGLPNDCLSILKEMPEGHRHPDAMVLNGYAQLKLGNPDTAARLAEAALQLSPLSAPALNLNGEIVYAQGHLDVARRWFRKAVSADPGYGLSHTNLGMLHWEAGRMDAALKSFAKGFMLAPDHTDIRQVYLNALRETGLETEALPLIRNSRHFYPHIKDLHFAFIECLLKSGNDAGAMAEIEENLVQFGVDYDVLDQALAVRKALGPKEIDPEKTDPTVSACMIIKNEEQYLARCLHSIKPICDEIIAADTGSDDRSRDIAVAFGADIFDFKWVDDFSKARNFTLSKASGDWIYIVDGDEVIAESDYQPFIRLTKSKKTTSYMQLTRNYIPHYNMFNRKFNDGRYPAIETGHGWIGSLKVRIFPNHEGIYFRFPVHEMVEPFLLENKMPIKDCPFPIHHFGMLNIRKSNEKNKRYYALGVEKLREEKNKENPHFIWELANVANAAGEHRHAVDLWKQYLDSRPQKALEVYIKLSLAYEKLGDEAGMLSASRTAYELDPDHPDSIFTHARVCMLSGRYEEAVSVLSSSRIPEHDNAHHLFILSLSKACLGEIDAATKMMNKLKFQFGINFILPSINSIVQRLARKNNTACISNIIEACSNCGVTSQKAMDETNLDEKAVDWEIS